MVRWRILNHALTRCIVTATEFFLNHNRFCFWNNRLFVQLLNTRIFVFEIKGFLWDYNWFLFYQLWVKKGVGIAIRPFYYEPLGDHRRVPHTVRLLLTNHCIYWISTMIHNVTKNPSTTVVEPSWSIIHCTTIHRKKSSASHRHMRLVIGNIL